MTIKRITAILILLLFITVSAFTETRDDAGEDNIEVSLVFIGPADALYSWWGHVAVIIENTKSGAAKYYDYGNFSFDQDSFVRNFVMGRLYFLKMASSPDRQLQYSVYLNRDVTVYKLNVPYDREIELYKFLENDILPENRIYLYDHFYDNCATRIRDMMDIITDGEFSERYNVISDKTLRVHLRRFIYSHPFMDWLLNFAMNGSVDRPVSELAGMYLPLELERGVAGMMIHDKNGEPVPFVRDIVVVNRAAGRAEIKAYPPPQWPYGLTFGLVLAAAAWFMKGKGFALFSTLLSFILAVPGTLLFFMACFTDHSFAYWNMNLLFVNPFMFATFVLSLRLLINRKAQETTVRRCWSITAVGALLSILLKIIPFCRQDNLETILIVVPPALVLSGIIKKRRPNVMT